MDSTDYINSFFIQYKNKKCKEERKITLLKKAQSHIEKFIWQKSLSRGIFQILGIIERRNIPIPSAVFYAFDRYDRKSSDPTEKFLEKYIVPENQKKFIDVGAHVGLWASFVAEKGIEVRAFEPNPTVYAKLKEKATKYQNFYTYSLALGGANYNTTYDPKSQSIVKKTIQDRSRKVAYSMVTVRTLDSFNFENVGVLKIDTEGFEFPVLSGAKLTIKKNYPLIIIEIHKGIGQALKEYDSELKRIINFLNEFDYSFHIQYRTLSLREIQPFLIALPHEVTLK